MNERIKALATEVGISVEYLTNTKQIVLIEKFAELIVRECASICDDYGMPDGTSPTAMILSAAIKKRFGVEE